MRGQWRNRTHAGATPAWPGDSVLPENVDLFRRKLNNFQLNYFRKANGPMPNTSSMDARLLIVLNERNVEYLVVGGWAVKHYCPDRKPRDLDLWIDPSNENKEKLRDALSQHFMQSTGDPLKDQLAQITTENRTSPMHICLKKIQQCEIFEPQRGFDFPSLMKVSVESVVYNVPAHIMSCCDLTRLKRFAIKELRSNPPKREIEYGCYQRRLEQEIWDVNCLMERCKTEDS